MNVRFGFGRGLAVVAASLVMTAGALVAGAAANEYGDLGDKTGQVNDFWDTSAHPAVTNDVGATSCDVAVSAFALDAKSVVASEFDTWWREDAMAVFLGFRVDYPSGICIILR